jgi:deoxyribodipyrimidine photo-lyase
MSQRIIYWFRNDLRLHDNEGFYTATKKADEVIPVYVFDPRQFNKTRFDFRRSGALRARFLLESVSELRNRLREKGSDLLIRIGEPEKIIAELAEDSGAEFVYTSKEIAPDETQVESSLSKNLKVSNIDIKLFWMNTLGNASELPFPISKLPKTFDQFYDLLKDGFAQVPLFPEPDQISFPVDYAAGIMPSLPMLGIDPKELGDSDAGTAGPFGETKAHEKLKEFVSMCNGETVLPETSDLLMQAQISKWISSGCLSARYILNNVKGSKIESIVARALLKRDYFHWTLLRYGSRLFKPSGINHNLTKRWTNDIAAFDQWKNAQTEDADVNDLILKLNATGYLTFEERIIASDYLANKLNINWTWGAMYFESLLIDYNVSNSWCNWNFVAGVAGDPVELQVR